MWARDSEARKFKNSTALLDAVLHDDPDEAENLENHEDPQIAVTRAEARAREDLKTIGAKKSARAFGSNRNYAEALHRQADLLHHRGDYETALILYHRAARAYPRESSHGVAARRTAAAISSAANPSRALRKLLPGAKNPSELAANFCPETAALRARKIVEESPDPVSSINQILKYFDSRQDFWRDPPIFQDRRKTILLSRSKIMWRQLSSLASATLKDLQAAFASGDFNRSLKTGNELLVIAEALPSRYRYQVAAHHYMAMTQISLGRHDRAVDQVSRMVRQARESGDVGLRSRSMMTLGRVHLSFGHLDAAARAWEKLVLDVEEAVPKAWLLHEIGRCYFEMKRFAKALEAAERCNEYADEGNSRKWLLHGKLLVGQSLVELGRFGEAVGALKVAADAARDEEDSEIHEYVSNLIDRVTAALRKGVFAEDPEEWSAKPVENRAWRAKSDDTLNCTKQTDWLSDKSEKRLLARSEWMEKSKAKFVRNFSRKMKSPLSARRKSTRIKCQLGRRNMGKRGNSWLSISPRGGSGTFDPGLLEKDINPLEAASPSKAPQHGQYPRAADLSSRPGGNPDESGDDQLTFRTRVIRRETPEDGNSPEILQCPGGSEVVVDEEASSSFDDDERSNRSGETYVVDESGISADDPRRAATTDGNFQLYVENQLSDKSEIIYELDNSKNGEYLRDARSNDLAILPVRACLYVEGINEADEDEPENEEDEEGESPPFNRREVFSSKVSNASTGETYVVDEKKTMSFVETTGCYVDQEDIMRSERRRSSSFASGPHQPQLRRRLDAEIIRDTVDTTGDSLADPGAPGYDNLPRMPKPLVIGASAERQEKFSSRFPTSFFAECSDTNSPGIRRPPVDHLATGESILPPRGYCGIALAAGQRPLHRHSLPTSPRKDLEPLYP